MYRLFFSGVGVSCLFEMQNFKKAFFFGRLCFSLKNSVIAGCVLNELCVCVCSVGCAGCRELCHQPNRSLLFSLVSGACSIATAVTDSYSVTFSTFSSSFNIFSRTNNKYNFVFVFLN